MKLIKYIVISVIFILLNIEIKAQGYWTQKASLPGPGREGAVGFSIGNKGFIGTGFYSDSCCSYTLNDFGEYDQNSNTWTQRANLPAQSSETSGFAVGG